jgi:hypothetical protein
MLRGAIAGLLLFSCSASANDGRLDVDPAELQPGLVAEYRSLADNKAAVALIETGELFSLKDGSSPRFELYSRGLYQDALSMLAEALPRTCIQSRRPGPTPGGKRSLGRSRRIAK